MVVMVTLQGLWYFYIGVALYTTAIYSEVDSYSDAEGSNASRKAQKGGAAKYLLAPSCFTLHSPRYSYCRPTMR